MAKVAASWTGPWTATFADGPHRGERRVWAVGPIWQEICLAPRPGHTRGSFVCGGDGIPGPVKEGERWPDETRYQLRSIKRASRRGETMVVAVYRRRTD